MKCCYVAFTVLCHGPYAIGHFYTSIPNYFKVFFLTVKGIFSLWFSCHAQMTYLVKYLNVLRTLVQWLFKLCCQMIRWYFPFMTVSDFLEKFVAKYQPETPQLKKGKIVCHIIPYILLSLYWLMQNLSGLNIVTAVARFLPCYRKACLLFVSWYNNSGHLALT